MKNRRVIDTPPAGREGWRAVWRDRLEFPEVPSTSLVYRVVRRILEPFVDRMLLADRARQGDYNLALLEMMDDIHSDLRAIRSDVEALRAHVDTQIPIAVRRNDALLAALDQKIENASARMRDLSLPLVRDSGTAGAREAEDFVYRRLEDGLRGTAAEIRAALEPCVERAAAHQPLLDLGCGRGELLRLCAERGIRAKGFDTNERSIADLREAGLDVEIGAIPGCLETLPAGSVGTIVASHVVEHLPSSTLLGFFQQAARVLEHSGLLIVETPNAESLVAAGSDFWRDPTHLAPRHAAALTLIARECGFGIDQSISTAPYPDSNKLRIDSTWPDDLQRFVQRLNEILFGDQNVRMVMKKSEE